MRLSNGDICNDLHGT